MNSSKLMFLLAAFAALICIESGPAHASVRFCSEPHCGSSNQLVRGHAADLFAGSAGIRAAFEDQRIAAGIRGPTLTDAPPLVLTGELAGDWDFVDGYLTFPLELPGEPRLEVLLRGFGAVPAGPERYEIDAWDRRVYWLDFGAGSTSQAPHLLGALELTNSYIPEPGDPIQQFVDDENVQAFCINPGDCSVNWVTYSLLREVGRDYTAYPEGAAVAELYFVADTFSGQVLSLVAVIFDETSAIERIDFLYENDELQLVTLGYDVAEPDFLFYVAYMDFETLSQDLFIELEHYVPGVDFVDPALPEDFDAANQPIQLLLEGERDDGETIDRAYGGPYDLGFGWQTVPDFVFGSEFESLRPEVTVPNATLVQPAKRALD